MKEMEKMQSLNISQMWYGDFDAVYRADSFQGEEYFYPIYRYENYYSLSPLKLIELKGKINFNKKILNYCKDGIIDSYLPPNVFIDKDIVRISRVIKTKKLIGTEVSFIQHVKDALIKDIRIIEEKHPDAVIGVLAGGKDSLNLLLLPWKNETLALSAYPNYPLVKEFCDQNGGRIRVIEISGESSDTQSMREIDCKENCCRIGLQDVRWTLSIIQLKEKIKKDQNKELVIITGSLGDVFLTPNYKTYQSIHNNFQRRLINRFTKNRIFSEFHLRGAQWQGCYHGILRGSAGIANYSAYHGPNMIEVLKKVNLKNSVKRDVRPQLGYLLKGEKVHYPVENPSPPSWNKRKEYSRIERFIDLMEADNIICH